MSTFIKLPAVLRSRSQGFLAGAGADLKFDLVPEPIPILGRLRLLFLTSEK